MKALKVTDYVRGYMENIFDDACLPFSMAFDLAKKIDRENLRPIKVEYTPEECEKLYNGRRQQRDVKQRYVNQYRDAMNDGSWEWDNPEAPLQITKGGQAQNAQHRLLAGSQRDSNSVIYTAFNASEKMRKLQDSSVPRTVRDRNLIKYDDLADDIWKMLPCPTVTGAAKLLHFVPAHCEPWFKSDGKPMIPNHRTLDDANLYQSLKKISPAIICINQVLRINSAIAKRGDMIVKFPVLAAFIFTFEKMSKKLWEQCLLISVAKDSSGEHLVPDSSHPMFALCMSLNNYDGVDDNNERYKKFVQTLIALKSVQERTKLSGTIIYNPGDALSYWRSKV